MGQSLSSPKCSITFIVPRCLAEWLRSLFFKEKKGGRGWTQICQEFLLSTLLLIAESVCVHRYRRMLEDTFQVWSRLVESQTSPVWATKQTINISNVATTWNHRLGRSYPHSPPSPPAPFMSVTMDNYIDHSCHTQKMQERTTD